MVIDEWLTINLYHIGTAERVLVCIHQLRAMLSATLRDRLAPRNVIAFVCICRVNSKLTMFFWLSILQKQESASAERKNAIAPWEHVQMEVPDFVKKIWRESLDPDFVCSEVELSGLDVANFLFD